MDISDEEEEDGQISRFEEEEERDRRLYDRLHPEKEKFVEDDTITLEDLEKVRLSRDMVARLSATPWFEETVKGAWIRYLNGSKDGQPTYRMFEVIGELHQPLYRSQLPTTVRRTQGGPALRVQRAEDHDAPRAALCAARPGLCDGPNIELRLHRGSYML